MKTKLINIDELEDIVGLLDQKGCPHYVGLWTSDDCPYKALEERCEGESCWWHYLEDRSMPWSTIRKELDNESV